MQDYTLFPFRGSSPILDQKSWIAPGARLIGAVTLNKGVSIWFNAVLRADLAPIIIGENSNIQDGCTVHVDPERPCLIGKEVITGHNAILHACTVEDHCLIGMGAIILSGAKIRAGTIVAAGALVKEGAVLEPESLYAGNPARLVRKINPATLQKLTRASQLYTDLITEYQKEQKNLPPT